MSVDVSRSMLIAVHFIVNRGYGTMSVLSSLGMETGGTWDMERRAPIVFAQSMQTQRIPDHGSCPLRSTGTIVRPVPEYGPNPNAMILLTSCVKKLHSTHRAET